MGENGCIDSVYIIVWQVVILVQLTLPELASFTQQFLCKFGLFLVLVLHCYSMSLTHLFPQYLLTPAHALLNLNGLH